MKSAKEAHAEILKIINDNKLIGIFMVADKEVGAWKVCMARQWAGTFQDENVPEMLHVIRPPSPAFLQIAVSIREFLTDNVRFLDDILGKMKSDGVELPEVPLKFNDKDVVH